MGDAEPDDDPLVKLRELLVGNEVVLRCRVIEVLNHGGLIDAVVRVDNRARNGFQQMCVAVEGLELVRTPPPPTEDPSIDRLTEALLRGR